MRPNAELCGGTSATNAVLNGKTNRRTTMLRDEAVFAIDAFLADAIGAALAGTQMPHEAVDENTPIVVAWVKAHLTSYGDLLSVLERCSCAV